MRWQVKKQFGILVFSSFISITGCNAKSNEKDVVSEIKVEPCGFDYDVDNYYCKADKINLYKKNIGSKPNFNSSYTIIKINDGKYFRIVALNQKDLKAYPLNYQIDYKSKFYYSVSNDSLCVTGDFYAYRDDYSNSKSCFKLINGGFVKTNVSEISSKSSKEINLKKVLIPNSSNYFSKCLKNNSQSKCEKLSDSENHVYGLDDVKKISTEIYSILSGNKINNLNLDGIKFLPNIGNSQFIIGEKYHDTDDGSSIFFYLIRINPKVEVLSIGENYSIDEKYNLNYRDSLGNNKKIKLN